MIDRKIFNVVIILLIISLITNILLFVSYSSKLRKVEIENEISEYVMAIETSNDTLEIHSFYETQLNKNLITENDLSSNYQELIDIHNHLIATLSKIETKNTFEIRDLTILLINDRKKAFENFKSAIDLNSSNYKNVAENLITNSEKYKTEIETKINNIK